MRTLLLLAVLAILFGCSDDGNGTTESTDPSGGARAAGIAGIKNMKKPLPGVITAGQLTEEQFDACLKAGIRNFVNLRLADEKGTGWEEAKATDADVRYVRIPVNGAKGINLENAKALDAALMASGGGETMVYCGSSNRVGALFGLRAHLIQGKSKEEAMTLARAAGATRYAKVLEEVLNK